MSGQDPGFFSYLYTDAARFSDLKALVFWCGAFILFLCLWLWLSGKLYAKLEDAAILSAPLATVVLYPGCEVRAYAGRVEFIRKGACVGRVESGVTEAVPDGTKEDRRILVTYPDRSQTISCGPAGWQDARKAAKMILHYAGGERYG